MRRVIIIVRGRVQGVGFRWWAASQARQLGITGHAKNLPDGDVEIIAQGDPGSVGALIRRTIEDPTTTARPGQVYSHQLSWHSPDPSLTQFRYR